MMQIYIAEQVLYVEYGATITAHVIWQRMGSQRHEVALPLIENQ